jgi:acetylornithine/succinyldiaminopimelate/putrescine aminotransferase
VTPTALRFEPSLLVTDDEIREAIAVLRAVLRDVEEAGA